MHCEAGLSVDKNQKLFYYLYNNSTLTILLKLKG